VDFWEIFGNVGPTVANLVSPAVRKAALYISFNRDRGGQYDERFRQLLALARRDVRAMRDNVEEIRICAKDLT
jgi:hypothetical protein